MLTSYEFTYRGRALSFVQQTIAEWCAAHGCALDVTSLLQGARFRVSGREEAVRDAMQAVRVWIRPAA
ncbi:MAG: hypothetical protein DMD78_00720 [Candidatus Rokuibacteriota bacterium]|nr:MAG: hypothetical protein DMD78_00720 [Candidatus Rokubacteria bacterium]